MKDITTIKVPAGNPFGRKGHQPHRSGAGKHADKRTKRTKTRSAQLRNVMREQ